MLARQDEEDPFSYAPSEVLKGAVDGAEIDLFVDSTTRRILQSDGNRRVLLVQNESQGEWRNLGIASDEYLSVVRRIIILGETWRRDDGAQRRLKFFLQLFGHKDPSIAQLAYLEMGRAPYPVIRQLGRAAPRESYASLLSDPMYVEWRSLAILLLAQSNDPHDRQKILDLFRSADRFRMTTNLAALATAVIEIQPDEAIRWIEDDYFVRHDRSPEEIQSVVKALSMHGSIAGPELQDRIIASYRVLLRQHPHLAPIVSRDLHAWKRHELVEQLSAILQSDSNDEVADRRSIRRYLRAAATFKELVPVND